MNAEPTDFIEDAAGVIEHYGGWPTLHDGQILNVSIDSHEGTIDALVGLCDAEFPSERATIMALRWEGVTDFQLASANLDGVLYEVAFARTKGGAETRFISKTGGITGRIRAARIKVTRYEPGEE